MASYIHLTGDDKPTPSYPMVYKKPTNGVGGWSFAARPEAEDSKFYELNGEWYYVLKDTAELISLRDQGDWITRTDTTPYQSFSITGKGGITKSIPLNNLVTTRVNNMSGMFRGSEYIYISQFNQYIGRWDVSNVTNMSGMFRSNERFSQLIENWDVRNVTSMRYMFYDSQFGRPLEKWDTGNVTDMSFMFGTSQTNRPLFNQPLNNWNVSNVTDMEGMFGAHWARFNQPLWNWDVSNVTNMRGMFRGITHPDGGFNQYIGNWAVHNVTNMDYMFDRNSEFNQDLSSWCVASVTSHTNFDAYTPSWTRPKPNFNNPPC